MLNWCQTYKRQMWNIFVSVQWIILRYWKTWQTMRSAERFPRSRWSAWREYRLASKYVYRFPKNVLLDLCCDLGPVLERETNRTKAIPMHIQLLSTLGFLATGTFQREVGDWWFRWLVLQNSSVGVRLQEGAVEDGWLICEFKATTSLKCYCRAMYSYLKLFHH